MAVTRWTVYEILKRVCSKLNHPIPATITEAELASDSILGDLIDTINDIVQDLVVAYWPEEFIKNSVVRTTPAISGPAAVTNGADTIVVESADLSEAVAGYQLMIGTEGNIYVITEAEEGLGDLWTITIDRTYLGESNAATTAYIFNNAVAMPANFHKPVSAPGRFLLHERMQLITPATLSRIQFTDSNFLYGGFIQGPPLYAVRRTDDTGADFLDVYPPSDQAYEFTICYYIKSPTFVVDDDVDAVQADEFMYPIPAQHQNIIVDAVLKELLSYKVSDPRLQIADHNMSNRLNRIAQEGDPTRMGAQITPSIKKGRRRLHGDSRRNLSRRYDLGDYFDRMDDE